MNITYLDVLSRYYPTIQVGSSGQNYSDIVWNSGGPVAQNVLESHMIDLAKEQKITEMSTLCGLDIISGFESAALGTPHIYDSEEVDQINLLGAITAIAPVVGVPDGFTIYYACRDVATGNKSYELHTYMQLRQVLNDGSMFKLGLLQKFHMKRVVITSLMTLEDIDNVTW